MDPTSVISIGTLRNVFTGDAGQVLPPIVVQCLQTRTLSPSPQAQERFRVVLSDTVHFVQCMLASQNNHLIKHGDLVKGSIIRLTSYQTNQIKERRVLIVIELEVLKEYGVHDKIGQPDSLEKALDKSQNSGELQRNPYPSPTATTATPEAATTPAFYGSKPSALPAPQRGQQFGANANAHIIPIEGLSPYQNKWTIKARVSLKSDIKTWKNTRGEGKVFTVHFLDETGEIRASGFNEQCDALYEVLQEGQVYYVSKARVSFAKKQFSSLSNDYEITFEPQTEVEKCEDQSDVPQLRFTFVPFAELAKVEKDAQVDVIGILRDSGDVAEITSKTTHKEYRKREITLADTSGFDVRMTLWGAAAQNFDAPLESVIAFKSVRVSDFGGRSLSMGMSSSMTLEPDIDEAYKLKGWFDATGRNETFQSHQALSGMGQAGGRAEVYKTLEQVVSEGLGHNEEKPDYYSTKATIVYLKQDGVSYPACMSEKCNKKVVENNPGEWRCENCDKTWPKPQYRYVITMSVNDAFSQGWLSCFDDVGRMIMGMSADELEALRGGEEKTNDYLAAFAEAVGKTYIFRCRAKMDSYGEQQRVRNQVVSASPPNWSMECTKLMETIRLYSQD
ncbi:replication factor A 1, rfa1 [Terfezia boudieri ATCC MYA-4762]|uniref:Replication protein A subunit n=1 Tax=Terfezia boudieri ATCC MYA-4762 TaxID=1051890 RepID=A0A3N4MPF2_9PEZI|nr:replication factor A 1, rfa1 [Terfezia boudieri ATCC MYA-4762]